jgi:glycerol uptake facilitator-like aquaporin
MAKALLAEFIGTFALIGIGAAARILASQAGTGGSLLSVAFAHGLTIMIFAAS